MARRFMLSLIAVVVAPLLAGCDENRVPQDPMTAPPAAMSSIAS